MRLVASRQVPHEAHARPPLHEPHGVRNHCEPQKQLNEHRKLKARVLDGPGAGGRRDRDVQCPQDQPRRVVQAPYERTEYAVSGGRHLGASAAPEGQRQEDAGGQVHADVELERQLLSQGNEDDGDESEGHCDGEGQVGVAVRGVADVDGFQEGACDGVRPKAHLKHVQQPAVQKAAR